MSTERASKTADAQLSEFGDAFWKSSSSVAIMILFGTLIFYPTLNAAGLLELGEQYLVTDLLKAYFLSSGLGLTLYISAKHISRDSEGDDGENNEENEEEAQSATELFFDGIRTIHSKWSVISYITILVGLGGIIGAATATYVSASLAPIVAIGYPMLDWSLSERVEYLVTPSGVLLVVSNLVIIPLTLAITSIAAIVGMVFGFLTGLIMGLLTPIRAVFEYLKDAGVDEAAKGPLRGTRRHLRLQK